MRHNSGQWKTSLVTRSHHPGDSYARMFICVSNSILFVWYLCDTISTLCLCDVCFVSSHLLFYPLSTLLSTDRLIGFAILDWWSIQTSLDRSGTIHTTHDKHPPSSTIITLDLPPSEDCRLVEWAQMTYKNIRHVLLLNRHQHQPNNPPYASRSLQY